MAEVLHTGFFGRLRTLIPAEFKHEAKELSTLALPVLLSQVQVNLIGFVSVIFCGHLGRTSLDGVTLATNIINVSAVSIGYGLSSASATLISQTFGSGNLKQVGVIVQRTFLILMIACFPCWSILINTESLLIAVKQSPEIARLSQLYVTIYMPALPGLFTYITEVSYLQNQGIIWPLVISGAAGNVINALCNYLFLFVLDFGIAGSAAANVASQYAMAIILFVYILYKDLHKDTWHGLSMDCLQEWCEFMRLGIPGMLMLCAEWWTYELAAFLAGLISDVELGSQAVAYQVANIAYMFPLGVSVAGGVRVGNALGAGKPEQAKLSAKITIACAKLTFVLVRALCNQLFYSRFGKACLHGFLVMSSSPCPFVYRALQYWNMFGFLSFSKVAVAVCLAAIIGSTKDVISYIFSNDQEIRVRVSKVMMLYAPFHLFDATTAAGGNIIRALGKQVFGAAGNLVGYYGIGFPIGASLMFAGKMGIVGLWTGLLICVFLQAVFFIVFLLKLNWVKITKEAQIRAGIHLDCNEYDSIQQANSVQLIDRDPHTDTETLTKNVSTLTARTALPLGVLMLRRGLTLLAMLFILTVGIALSLTVNT